jgi:hypothetical protein
MKIIFALIILTGQCFAQSIPKNSSSDCPEDSFCSKETGEKRAQFKSIISSIDHKNIKLTNDKLTKDGLYPITIWATENLKYLEIPVFTWNSPCPQHNIKDSKILIGELFVPSLKNIDLKKYSGIIFSKIIYKVGNKIKQVVSPRGDTPLGFNGNQFYYTKEIDGIYYGLLLNTSGELEIMPPQKIDQLPREINCTKELLEAFYRESPSINFYKGAICKEIWDSKNKTVLPIISGWSCN